MVILRTDRILHDLWRRVFNRHAAFRVRNGLMAKLSLGVAGCIVSYFNALFIPRDVRNIYKSARSFVFSGVYGVFEFLGIDTSLLKCIGRDCRNNIHFRICCGRLWFWCFWAHMHILAKYCHFVNTVVLVRLEGVRSGDAEVMFDAADDIADNNLGLDQVVIRAQLLCSLFVFCL